MFDNKEIAKRALHRAEELKIEKKRRRIRWKSAVTVGVCAASIVFVIIAFPIGKLPDDYILFNDDEIPLAVPLLTDDNAVPYNEDELKNNTIIYFPEYDTVTVQANLSDVKMTLLNPDGNTYWFTFEIILEDTEETLYESGLVAPAMCIENITLERPLEKGEYKTLLIIRSYDLESFAEVNDVSVEFDLIAE